MFKGKRVLLVDDDQDYLVEVSKYLSGKGFFVYPKSTMSLFMESLNKDHPDIVLLDKEIGKEDGFDLIHEVRTHEKLSSLPIIIVSGVTSSDAKKEAIMLGADDFLEKPLSLSDLELRIISCLRRSKSYHRNDHLLTFSDIEVDLRTHVVKIGDQVLSLTMTEYKIFVELVSKRGTVVNREQIAQRFLSFRNTNARTLDVHINSLRKKLGKYAECIKTIRGRGYMFLLEH